MGFDYRRGASGIVVITMDMDGQSANTMSPAYHTEMGATVARLEAEEGLRGVVFASAKKTFFAGGDLHGLMKAERGDDAYKAWLNEDKGYLRRLEKLPVPVVAAINGAALGGGFEICLACNHRIIVDHPAAVVGLPEVTLGLLPGAGGVARLPRIAALDTALDLLLSGRFVAPQEALSSGLVDRIVAADADLLPAAIAWIDSSGADHRQAWDRETAAAPEPAQIAAAKAKLAAQRRTVAKQTRGKLPSPMDILDIVEAGLEQSLDETLALETEKFAALLGRKETRAAIWLNFFAANAIRSGKLRPEGPRKPIDHLCIQGTGAAAEAIAAAAAKRATVSQAAPHAAAPDCDLLLHFATAQAAPQPCGAPICGVELRGRLAQADIAACDPEAVFGFRLADGSAQSRLVEIIAGPDTSQAALCGAYDFFQRIGRVPIRVADDEQHYVAALRAAYDDEARRLAAEGLTAAEIEALAYDAGMTIAAGAAEHASEQAEAQGEAQAPQEASDPARLRADAEDRLLYRQAIAALTALQNGIIATQEEADIGAVTGAGFPPHTGGALRFVHGIGAQDFHARSLDLARRYGQRFAVTEALLCPLHANRTQAA